MISLLDEIIKRATEELNAREKARDEVLNRARTARMLSKQAILIIHNKDFLKAESNLIEAKKVLQETKKFTQIYSELDFYEEVEAAKEEYSEAAILFNLQKRSSYPLIEDLEVTSFQSLLGLADVPGELRRETGQEDGPGLEHPRGPGPAPGPAYSRWCTSPWRSMISMGESGGLRY